MHIFAIVALIILSAGCTAAGPNASTDSLVLQTGGAAFEAQFETQLSADGMLRVRRYGPPHVTPRKVEKLLPAARAAALFSLAARATDFSAGCGKVADGTNAAMTVNYAGNKHTFSCTGASHWPTGKNTTTFLSTLNNDLPHDLQVH